MSQFWIERHSCPTDDWAVGFSTYQPLEDHELLFARGCEFAMGKWEVDNRLMPEVLAKVFWLLFTHFGDFDRAEEEMGRLFCLATDATKINEFLAERRAQYVLGSINPQS